MTIRIKNGIIQWHFYRKAYRKSRWRKLGQRQLDAIMKYGYTDVLIIVI